MALSYKARRISAVLLLVVGLPVYIVASVSIIALFDRPPILVELGVYILLGILWAFPFKFIFKGVGQADPDAPTEEDER